MKGPPCAVTTCTTDAIACFETYLCLEHGTQANRWRDKRGLTDADWGVVVKAVAAWIQMQNREVGHERTEPQSRAGKSA